MMMAEKTYAVFLSFNSQDREAVEQIALYLADKAGLRPWFDQWELIPGEPWTRNLERGLEASSTCAVFVGKSGEGPWQIREVETALRHQIDNHDFRVIPVLLPDAPQKPELPMFLSGNMWVDFRKAGLEDDDALWRLECGILGKAPGRGRSSSAANHPGVSSGQAAKKARTARKIAPNPFGDRGCITNPKRFFDRESILRQILENLHKGSSVALIGEFRIGKSSLLAMLRHVGPKALKLPDEAFLYLDMQPIRNEDEFFEALCDQIDIPTCRGFKLARALRGKRYILGLDEIEKMNRQEHFSRDVREELRGLAGSPDTPLSLVIASRSPLEQLFPDSPGMTSPLANVCVKLDVKPFSSNVARNFLIQRLKHSGITFTEHQISDLIERSGGHPGKLQDEAARLYNETVSKMDD